MTKIAPGVLRSTTQLVSAFEFRKPRGLNEGTFGLLDNANASESDTPRLDKAYLDEACSVSCRTPERIGCVAASFDEAYSLI